MIPDYCAMKPFLLLGVFFRHSGRKPFRSMWIDVPSSATEGTLVEVHTSW